MGKICSKGHLVEGKNIFTTKKNGKEYTTCRQCSYDRHKTLQRQKFSLPPDTPSVMASFKEPLRPVSQGYGYYGTIAYDETKEYTQCHLCGRFFGRLGPHLKPVHGKTVEQYKQEMGLPNKLSLNAPNHKSATHRRWEKMSLEKRKQWGADMQAHAWKIDRPKKRRQKSLYYKNIEGRCPDQLLNKILTLSEKLGRTPSKSEFVKAYGTGTEGSVRLTFGSWNEAVRAVNLQPNKPGKLVYDRESLLKYLFDFRERYGREPMTADLNKGLLPSAPTYRRFFGSFTAAKAYVIK